LRGYVEVLLVNFAEAFSGEQLAEIRIVLDQLSQLTSNDENLDEGNEGEARPAGPGAARNRGHAVKAEQDTTRVLLEQLMHEHGIDQHEAQFIIEGTAIGWSHCQWSARGPGSRYAARDTVDQRITAEHLRNFLYAVRLRMLVIASTGWEGLSAQEAATCMNIESIGQSIVLGYMKGNNHATLQQKRGMQSPILRV